MRFASPVDAVAIASILLIAGLLLTRCYRGLRAAGRIVWRRTRPTMSVESGQVEVQGTVHAVEHTTPTLEDRPAVYVASQAWVWVPGGKGGTSYKIGSSLRHVACTIKDATGECALSFEDAEVLGEIREFTVTSDELRRDMPDLAAELLTRPGAGTSLEAFVPESAMALEGRTIRIEQTFVPAGAAVLVNGRASVSGAVAGDGYRKSRATYVLKTEGEEALVVSVGNHTQALLRSVGPALVTAAGVLSLGAMALMWLSASLQAARVM